VPVFICPNCKARPVDTDGYEGFSQQTVQCRSCSFGFLFQLLEDYYPAPTSGLVVCDAGGRILAAGRGVFELSGFRDGELLGRDVAEAFSLSDPAPIETVREWGVRQLGKKMQMTTRGGIVKDVIVDLFPAYDDDGGLLLAMR